VRLCAVLALVGCIYESGGMREGGTGGAGGGGAGGNTGGCNVATGMGCTCANMACPAATDVCTSFGVGGQFCSNACTQQDQAVSCALAPGQPGQPGCLLIFNGGSMADHCVVLCATGSVCPAGMVAQVIQNTCVCVGP
jgi:hypothetical protein